MKKAVLWVIVLVLGLFFVFNTAAFAEVIKSFDSNIVVNRDGGVTVTETITYDSEGLEKHGIFRDITLKSSQGEKITITDISVTDASGTPYQWKKQDETGSVRLKIGDPAITFNGQKIYVIRYRAVNTIAKIEGADEIYWNTTGNSWPFSIDKATARVLLPEGVSVLRDACYVGGIGSTERCQKSGDVFYAGRILAPNEGMTVATGFPSGSVATYTPSFKERTISIAKQFWPTLIPIGVFVFMFRKWYRKGRDPKGSGVIIPEYDVPETLTPLEVEGIVSEQIKTKSISAEIIYLAIRGYIKITQFETKVLIFSNKDYKLTLQKDFSDIDNEFDKKILTSIFGTKSSRVTTRNLSTLEKKFYTSVSAIKGQVKSSLLTKGYYTNFPTGVTSIVLFIFFFISLQFGSIFLSAGSKDVFVFVGASILSFIIFAVFSRLMPAKSVKGVKMREQLLGLKEYLQIAEKDRLQFHNAPDKKPELFEKLLPYAMVFGVEKEWAKEFEGIYTTAPAWYEGGHTGFSPRIFVGDLNAFESRALRTATSHPRSSGGGSGGGGFSGGGAGGGGGGSW